MSGPADDSVTVYVSAGIPEPAGTRVSVNRAARWRSLADSRTPDTTCSSRPVRLGPVQWRKRADNCVPERACKDKTVRLEAVSTTVKRAYYALGRGVSRLIPKSIVVVDANAARDRLQFCLKPIVGPAADRVPPTTVDVRLSQTRVCGIPLVMASIEVPEETWAALRA